MIGAIRGITVDSNHSRPWVRSAQRRVKKPAVSGMPRKISTVRETSQMLISNPWVSRPSRPGRALR